VLGAVRGWVLLLDDGGRRLQVAEVFGTDVGQRGAVVPVDEEAWSWAAGTRRPLVTRGAPPPIRSPHVSAVPGAGRASITIPLVAEDAPVGVLSLVVEDDGPRDFTEQDLDAMEVFAGHAAVAIVNARAYEKERDLREKLAEVDAQRRESIAHLTHDLKAPLTSILGYAQLLTRLGSLEGDEARSYADTIQRQGHRIVEMVERLVIATRLEDSRPTLKRERLDLPEIVSEQVDALRGLLGERRVDLRIPVDLPAVWGDRSSVEHCLVNLLDNAVKYSPDGSTILVEVGTEESEILIAVVDEGEGIPEESLPNVFDRYQRGSEEGGMASVGLGLFIVQSLAQAQGGRAVAENEPGKGARVTFTLPYRRDDR